MFVRTFLCFAIAIGYLEIINAQSSVNNWRPDGAGVRESPYNQRNVLQADQPNTYGNIPGYYPTSPDSNPPAGNAPGSFLRNLARAGLAIPRRLAQSGINFIRRGFQSVTAPRTEPRFEPTNSQQFGFNSLEAQRAIDVVDDDAHPTYTRSRQTAQVYEDLLNPDHRVALQALHNKGAESLPEQEVKGVQNADWFEKSFVAHNPHYVPLRIG